MADEPKNEVKTTSQPIDPNSLLQGYLVGCRLRAMRGKKPVVPSDGQYEVIFANSELYIKKAPAVMLGTVLSLSGADTKEVQ